MWETSGNCLDLFVRACVCVSLTHPEPTGRGAKSLHSEALLSSSYPVPKLEILRHSGRLCLGTIRCRAGIGRPIASVLDIQRSSQRKRLVQAFAQWDAPDDRWYCHYL